MAEAPNNLNEAVERLLAEATQRDEEKANTEKIDALRKQMIDKLSPALLDALSLFNELGLQPGEVIRELRMAVDTTLTVPKAKPSMFRTVPLPHGLTNEHLCEAMDYATGLIASMNRDLRAGTGKALNGYIQSNNFSGIVSNILTDGMDKFSPYKHNDDQSYPDLIHENGTGLEMKAANKAGKGGESHNGHSGWHLIACFETLDDGNVRFVQVEVGELVGHADEKDGDWHYCGSTVNDAGSQRTETYYTTDRGTWKLRDGSVYLDTDRVDIRGWRRQDPKTESSIGIKKWKSAGITVPPHSPFYALLDDE